MSPRFDALLARYGGRTLESYRADLRQFFQWCAAVDVAPLAATHTHIELYRAWMDQRGLAPSRSFDACRRSTRGTSSPTSGAVEH